MIKAKNNNIFLIGPMGAGKSSVGRFLAKQLGMDFYDSDEEIEKSTGVDLGWIFDVEGEEGFRKREAAVVAQLAKRSNIVLATGGGTIVEPENQKILASRGMIVYLEVSLEHQEPRVVNESRRPSLRVKNRQEVLKQLQEERLPIYQSLADFKVHTDNRSVRAVADDIVTWLKKEKIR
ncbi:MAG: shikimate kinase AroK [Gammaproteobacteria bacterium]|nr:shikimate kinase AroK [Gammaproteobacteria bacterium]